MALFKKSAVSEVQLREFPFSSELNMEAYIVENPLVLRGDSDELGYVRMMTWELSYEDGRGSEQYRKGRIDILAILAPSEEEVDVERGALVVVELKNDLVNKDNLEQLTRYLEYFKGARDTVYQNLLKRLGSELDISEAKFKGLPLKGMIVGAGFDDTVEKLLAGGHFVLKDVEIMGIGLKRYQSPDTEDAYIFTNVLAAQTSKLSITRLKTFEEFKEFQKTHGRAARLGCAESILSAWRRERARCAPIKI